MAAEVVSADITILVAIIAGSVSIITALVTVLVSNYQWKKDFLLKFEEPELLFLRLRVEHRLQTYPAVFKLLGAIRDSDPVEIQKDSLKANPGQLLPVATELEKHLYGEAGLFMSFDTRSAVLKVWEDCHLFQKEKIAYEDLIADFFFARRYLRADLQLDDIKMIKSDVEKRKDQRK